MAIDSKGNNHQPKGTPNAGRFVPKAGRSRDGVDGRRPAATNALRSEAMRRGKTGSLPPS